MIEYWRSYILPPDTTGHPQQSYDCALTGRGVFWLHKGNLHIIKQVVLMLLLISVNSLK